MKIVHSVYGHIKARWDNHQNCLSCSSCSRLSTCLWSEKTWILADKRPTYSARRSVMRKKKQNKKRLAVNSDASEDNSFDGSTTPQGYTARGKTHHGGDYMDVECIQSMSTSHRSTSYWSTSHWSASHRSTTLVSQSRSTRHQSVYHRSTRH